MGNNSSSLSPEEKMLQSLMILCVCGTGVLGDYFMPGFSGRVKPNPTDPPTTAAPPPPACDSCCPTPPPVDEDKIACAALDKRLVVLEDALRDHECSAESADDETMELCAQLTFEATPLCMNATNIDSDECFRRVGQELGKEGIMDACKCEAWKQLKEDLMVSLELVCDDSRKGKNNQCITPFGTVLWWRYLQCSSQPFAGRLGCAWFLNNQRCFNTWANSPVWAWRRRWAWQGNNNRRLINTFIAASILRDL